MLHAKFEALWTKIEVSNDGRGFPSLQSSAKTAQEALECLEKSFFCKTKKRKIDKGSPYNVR